MKWKSIGRAALATGMSLGIGLGATACSRDYTVAYVYATSAQTGTISAFAVDYQSGALTQITGSPFQGTGTTPVAIVPSPNGKYIYVVNNFTSAIGVYAVGTDGKLYGQATTSLSPVVNGTVIPGGSLPTAATIDSTGSFLYVTFTLQPGYTTASPGKGGVTIFPINQTNGLLGTPVQNNGLYYVPVGNNPVSIAVSEPICYTTAPAQQVTLNASCNSGTGHYAVYAYVLDQEPAPNAAILGFSQNMTTGSLALLSGASCTTTANVLCTGYAAGVRPSSVVVEPTTRYVYAADEASNQIYGYQIANNTTGNLTGLRSSPSISGLYPVNLTVDPRGKFLLSANQNSNTVGSYAINSADGSLGGVAGAGAATVATAPTCVAIEPALGIYVYTSNSLDGSISGLQMNPSTGALTTIPNSPFPTTTLPSCVTAVANGSHASSVVNP